MSLSVSRSSGNAAADNRFAWGAAAAAAGDHAAAVEIFEQTLEAAPGFAVAAFALGVARAALGQRAGACKAFALALALDPADELGAALHLARLGHCAAPDIAPPAYVRELFDAYAGTFDSHLSQALAYCGPQVLAALVAQISPHRFARALDLGCGTGLAGEVFRPRCDFLVGCDLSPKMIAQARHKAIYDRLEVAELAAFLRTEPRASASLILAADVFVYTGDLAAIFRACAEALAQEGLLAFTVQKGGRGFSLGPDLRYAHSLDYVAATANQAGLVVLKHPEISTRKDAGADVPGLGLVLARR